MFINFTNHPSIKWSVKQLEKAKEYGEIIDISFPHVSPTATKEEINNLALKYVEIIKNESPSVVLVQGEMSLSFNIIRLLKKQKIKTVCACSRRNVKEIIENNQTVKTAIFEFIQFREY